MEHTCDACSLWLTDECDHPDRMGRRNAPACEDFEGNRLADARETIARMAEEIERLCDLHPLPHKEESECLIWYDGCHCTMATLAHNIDRADRAEAEVARLKAHIAELESGATEFVTKSADCPFGKDDDHDDVWCTLSGNPRQECDNVGGYKHTWTRPLHCRLRDGPVTVRMAAETESAQSVQSVDKEGTS